MSTFSQSSGEIAVLPIEEELEALDDLLSWSVRQCDHGDHLYASIIEPLPGGLMRQLSSYNIPYEYVAAYNFYAHYLFSWGRKVKTIAGRCATVQEPIFIPDGRVKDYPYAQDFVVVEPGLPARGGLSFPVMDDTSKTPHCLAVVTVISTDYNILTPDHIRCLQEKQADIRQILKNLATQRRAVTIEYLDRVGYSGSVKENNKPISLSAQDALRTVSAEFERNRAQPTKIEQALQLFMEAPKEGVAFEALLELVSGAKNPEHAAVIMINKLNARLEPSGFRIERPRLYQLVPLTESRKNNAE